MKKILSWATVLVLGTGLLFGTATGCSHEHEYGEWTVLVPATCTSEGRERRDCKICEDYQIRQVSSTPHTFSVAYSADGAKHWKECLSCKQKFEESEHEFSGDFCSVCEYDKKGTGALKYEMNSDKQSFTVTGILGSAPEQVVIPDRYVGYPVTRIGKSAFLEQRTMKRITLPASLSEIETDAFKNCSALEQIDLPVSLTGLQGGAFSGCTSLRSISIEEGNAYYKSAGGILYDNQMTKFLHVPAALEGEVVIPETVIRIENGDFAGCGKLQKVTVGANVERIGDQAFKGCVSLTEFTVEGGGTEIGQGALFGCSSLQKLVLANTWQDNLQKPSSDPVTNRRTGDSYLGFLFGATNCTGTGSSVPASLKTVEFTGGSALYNYMFSHCANIEEVILPASVRTIEDHVFGDCHGLKKVTVNEQNSSYASQSGVLYDKAKTGIRYVPEALEGEIVIPEGVTQISAETFKSRLITSVRLPASLKYIGDEAFSDCRQLQTVTIPEESNLTSFGSYSFFNCSMLGSIVIPAKTVTIGSSAFVGCTALSSADFKVKEGWSRAASTSMDGSTEVPASELATPALAARQLTGANSMYYWSRKTA